MKTYHQRQEPFSKPRADLVMIRFRSTRLRALFWFHACYFMRGPNREEGVVNSIARLFRQRPDLFRPEVARRFSWEYVAQVLRDSGLGFKADEIARGWVRNAFTLHQLWNSDPQRLFADQPSYDTALARIRNRNGLGFFGFQEKMVSLLIHYLIEAGLLKPFYYPGPAERHVLRIMFGHEIAVPDDYRRPVSSKHVLAPIRDLLLWYCQRHQVDPVDLHNAIWILSRRWCQQHPGNDLQIDGQKDGRRTKYHQRPYTWDQRWRAVFARTCGQCPIQSTCRRCMPDQPYYVSGDVYAVWLRDQPPEDDIPF